MNKMKLVIVWVVAFAIALFVVKGTKIGPVVFTISEKHGMGVHSFDLVAFIPMVVALLFTVKAIKKR